MKEPNVPTDVDGRLVDLLERALNEGRNVMPDATDDEARAIEAFAAKCMSTLSAERHQYCSACPPNEPCRPDCHICHPVDKVSAGSGALGPWPIGAAPAGVPPEEGVGTVVTVKWGRKLDCGGEGCVPPHEPWMEVYPWITGGVPDVSQPPPPINGHRTMWVRRQITTGPWSRVSVGDGETVD